SSAQREPQHSRHCDGHQPPRIDPGRDEGGCASDREHDAGRRSPVVAHDEVPPEMAEGADAAHAKATRRRLSEATAPKESRTTNASTPGNDALSPGQCAPAPSADQKIPNVVSITPTANLSEFSGTRVSGPRTSTPTTATSTRAMPAPSAARSILPWALPKVMTMNATSSPSSRTP